MKPQAKLNEKYTHAWYMQDTANYQFFYFLFFLNQSLHEQISFLQFFRTSFSIFCKKCWIYEKRNYHGFSCLMNSSKHPHPLNHQNLLSVTKVFCWCSLNHKDWIVSWPPENQGIRYLCISSKLGLQCQSFKAF